MATWHSDRYINKSRTFNGVFNSKIQEKFNPCIAKQGEYLSIANLNIPLSVRRL